MIGNEGTIIAMILTGALLLGSQLVSSNGILRRLFGKKTKPSKGGKKGSKKTATGDASGGTEKIAHARAFLQTALDQASQAESASARANSGNRSSRMSAAEQAHYNAVAAEQAAGSATDAAAGGPIEANDAAAQARNAAARARAAADRARYNASLAS
jgi:hypothetical protein